MADAMAATGTVNSQVTAILPSKDHCTLCTPCSRIPTVTTDPIWQCVELTGMPSTEAITTDKVDPSSMAKPLLKLTCVRSWPTVCSRQGKISNREGSVGHAGAPVVKPQLQADLHHSVPKCRQTLQEGHAQVNL